MDLTRDPGYAEARARIERAYGPLWAERFAALAPLMFEDSDGPLAKAFLYGLDANAAGSKPGQDVAWQACEAIVDEVGANVVREAEQILGG
jgi:hypothetical protein